MALATLSIDLVAKIAALQEGFDKAAALAEKNSQQIAGSFDKLAATAITAGAAFVSAFSIDAFKQLITGAIDAQDHLNDLAKSTQLSVIEIGGIGFAASQAGSDLDGAAASFGKLNLTIGKANAGNEDAVSLFKKLGVSLKDDVTGGARSTAAVFGDLAEKFNSYADGPNKAALGNAIFGKSYQSILPLIADGKQSLQDSIAYFEKYSGVTAESAAQSDAFNDTLGKLHLIQSSLGTQLANSILPVLQSLADAFLDGKEKSTVFATAADALRITLETLVVTGATVKEVFTGVGDTLGAEAAYVKAIVTGDLAGAKSINAAYSEILAGREKALAAFNAKTLQGPTAGIDFGKGDSFDPEKPKPDAPILGSGNVAKQAAAIDSYIKKLNEEIITLKTAGNSYAEYNRVIQQLRTEEKLKDATPEKIAKLKELARTLDSLRPQFDAYSDGLKRAGEASADADEYVLGLGKAFNALVEATPTAQLGKLQRQMQELAEAFQAGKFGPTESEAALKAYSETVQTILGTLPEQFAKTLDAMQQLAVDGAKNITDELGNTIGDVLDGQFHGILADWGNLLKKMAAQAIAQDIGKSLFGDAAVGGSSGIGGLLGKIFPTLLGVGSKASGGSVQPFSLTRVNENGAEGLTVQGRDYIMTGGAGGKVTPAGAGAGGGDVVFNIASGVSRAELAALLPTIKQQVIAEVAQRQRRPGYSGAA